MAAVSLDRSEGHRHLPGTKGSRRAPTTSAPAFTTVSSLRREAGARVDRNRDVRRSLAGYLESAGEAGRPRQSDVADGVERGDGLPRELGDGVLELDRE